MKHVDIYTDGACSGNPGPGGWAAVLLYGEHRLEISGYKPSTTNNRMELTAAIEALKQLKIACTVGLYSDSTYVCNAFNKQWIVAWQKTNFTRKGEDIPNRDLWMELLALTRAHRIEWHWVRGHASNQENNRCDELARKAIRDAVQD